MTGACSGCLILHTDDTVAGCTNDDDPEGCAGRDLRHQGDPHRCFEWWDGCAYFGVPRLLTSPGAPRAYFCGELSAVRACWRRSLMKAEAACEWVAPRRYAAQRTRS